MKREEQIKEAARQRAGQYDHPSKWSDTYYGFIDGAKWADQHPQWIPVEERLPEEKGSYWCCDDDDNCEETLWNGHCWTGFADDDVPIEGITHWMLLPQPPRKDG